MNRMKQLSIWIIAFWMAMTAGAATVQAQSVNMSRYITLTVQSGQPIKLRFQAAAAGTPVLVKSGSNNQTITVGTSWSPDQNFTSDGTTMTVYGDITGFDCSNNRANLTALDVSHNTRLKELFGYNNLLTALDVSACTQLERLSCFENRLTALDVSACTQLERLSCHTNRLSALDVSACTQLERLSCFENRLTALDVSACTRLKELGCTSNELPALDVSACTQLEGLSCYNNNFSTAALNRLYCSLPDRTGETDKGKIYPAYNATNAGHADVLASSGHIATGKNWEVIYGSDDSDIPTTGTETCGSSALTVSPATLSFVAAGEMKPITVTASGAWTAVSSETWLTLSAGSGTGNGSVDATAAAYTGTTPRTAKVTFTAGSITREVNVTQQAASAPPTLTVSPATLSFVAAGETKPVTVTANGAWTAVSSEAWLTLAPATGTGDATVNATAAANPGSTRTATLTFSGGGLTRTIAVTQAGTTLSVAPAALDFTFAGEDKALTVTATQPWTARCDAPWITLSALSGTGNGTITVTAPAYADEWPRTAKIFFVSGALKDTVTVTQHPKPGPKFLALDYTELTLPVGASQRLVVTAYPKDADINRGVKWYSLNDDIATVSANGTVTALKPGRTDITVVANVGGQQTTCRVRVVPAEQMVTVTSGSDNTLRIALMAPSDADFTLSFDVDLPEGFALDAKKTAPDASLADGYTVTVTGNRVEMKPGGLRAGGTIKKRDLLTLACTAVPGTSNGSYKGALRNLSFTPTAGYALRNVTVPFTFTYTVANETVDGLRVYAHGSALYLTLPKAETIHIYNVGGSLVKTLALSAGDHIQPLPSGVYLVRVGEQVTKILVK